MDLGRPIAGQRFQPSVSVAISVAGLKDAIAILVDGIAAALRCVLVHGCVSIVAVRPADGSLGLTVVIPISRKAGEIAPIAILVNSVPADVVASAVDRGIAIVAVTIRGHSGAARFFTVPIEITARAGRKLVHKTVAIFVARCAFRRGANLGSTRTDLRIGVVAVRPATDGKIGRNAVVVAVTRSEDPIAVQVHTVAAPFCGSGSNVRRPVVAIAVGRARGSTCGISVAVVIAAGVVRAVAILIDSVFAAFGGPWKGLSVCVGRGATDPGTVRAIGSFGGRTPEIARRPSGGCEIHAKLGCERGRWESVCVEIRGWRKRHEKDGIADHPVNVVATNGDQTRSARRGREHMHNDRACRIQFHCDADGSGCGDGGGGSTKDAIACGNGCRAIAKDVHLEALDIRPLCQRIDEDRVLGGLTPHKDREKYEKPEPHGAEPNIPSRACDAVCATNLLRDFQGFFRDLGHRSLGQRADRKGRVDP